MKRWMSNFKGRIALAIGGSVAVVILCILFVVDRTETQRITEERGQALQSVAATVAAVFEQNLQEREREISLLARQYVLVHGDLASPRVKERLNDLKDTYGFYAWIGVADVDGQINAASAGMLHGRSVAERPWFKAGLNGQFVGDVHEAVLLAKLLDNPTPDEPMRFIDFAAPIHGPDGRLRGVVGAHANWAWADSMIGDVLKEADGHTGVEAFVVSGTGKILYPFSAIGKVELPPLPVDDRFRGVVDWQNEAYLTGVAKVDARVANDLGWRIVVRQPVALALAPVADLDQTLVVIGGLAIVLSVLLAFMVAKRMSYPLVAIELIAHRIANGQSHVEFPASTGIVDIDRLANSLQSMLDQLQIRQESILQQQDFTAATMDAIAAPMCVLDSQGKILIVNQAWRQFRIDNDESASECHDFGVGSNYLDVCSNAAHNGEADAARVLEGICQVLNGDTKLFTHVYPCHSLTQKHWYKLTATPCAGTPTKAVLVHEEITALREANEKLSIRDLELSLALDSARMGVYNWDILKNELGWSKEFRKVFSFSSDLPATYENWIKSLMPEDRQKADDQIKEAMDKGVECDIEYRIYWPDESVHWIQARGRFIYDASGVPIRMHGVVADITGRKQVEQELARHREHLEVLVHQRAKELEQAQSDNLELANHLQLATDAVGIGIWRMNFSDSALTWDKRMRELYGVPFDVEASALNYDFWRSRVHPDDIAESEKAFTAALRNGTPYNHPFRIVLPSGEIRHLQPASAIEYDEQGRPICIIGTNQDVTHIKRLELQLRASLEDKDAILNSDIAGFWITKNRKTLWLNEIAAKDLGYVPAELIGKSTRDCYTDQASYEQFGKAREEAFSAGKTFHIQWQWRHKNGEFRWFDITAVPMPSDPEATIWVAVNIEALKQAESALNQSKLRAEEANRAKSAFLATMSHEIRTPLNAIIGTTYLLAQSQLAPTQQRSVDTIESSSKNLLALINDILDFSKIEAGELALDIHDFSLGEILQDLRFMFGSLAESKGLAINIATPPATLPSVHIGDGGRLRQILNNLLSNAIKFTSQGAVTLRVEEVGHTKGAACRLRFSVTDSGIGIGKEAQEKLFQAFSQVDSSISRRYGGTGLGLSIVKRLAEMMGGKVGVDSILGQGSTFWVEVPLEIADREQATDKLAMSAQPLYVLVAEDSSVDRQRLISMCQDFGWQAHGFESGRQLIQHVDKSLATGRKIDCVVLDWKMPELDGVQVLSLLRERIGAAEMPAIIMATAHDVQSLNDCLDQTVPDSILKKPVEHSALFNGVNEAVVAQTYDLAHVLRGSDIRHNHCRWLSGVRVLVVDDSSINLEVLKLLLAGQGAEPTLCSSGQEAVALLEQETQAFDVVLMDLQMPEMDGSEATRLIRQKWPMGTLPIIALTAGATTTQHQIAMAAGMDDFLTKPVDPIVLIRVLRRYVEDRLARPVLLLPEEGLKQPDTQAPWPEIAGIDCGLARKLFRNDVALFKQCLVQFVDENVDVVADVQVLIDQGDRAMAASRIHKLRGQAANIGAASLYHAAGELEGALASAAADLKDPFAVFAASAQIFF